MLGRCEHTQSSRCSEEGAQHALSGVRLTRIRLDSRGSLVNHLPRQPLRFLRNVVGNWTEKSTPLGGGRIWKSAPHKVCLCRQSRQWSEGGSPRARPLRIRTCERAAYLATALRLIINRHSLLVCSSGASHVELFPGEVVSREAFYRSSCHKYPTTVSLPLFISLYLSLSGLQQQMQKCLYFASRPSDVWSGPTTQEYCSDRYATLLLCSWGGPYVVSQDATHLVALRIYNYIYVCTV